MSFHIFDLMGNNSLISMFSLLMYPVTTAEREEGIKSELVTLEIE